MKLLFFNNMLSDDFIRSVSWTLAHSLWQGLIAAFLAAIIILLTRKSSARLRYDLLIFVSVLFLITVAITFYSQLQRAEKENRSLSNNHGKQDGVLLDAQTVNYYVGQKSELNQSLANRFTNYFNDYAFLIVLIWLFFFILKCIRLLAGLHYVHRVRHQFNYEVPDHWKERLYSLSRKIGVSRTILFLESELVKVPVVIGMLKPAILVPIGLLNNLPAEQVEAILLHELAHIRRKDFLVNLVQSIVETIFFFNPAVIWIASLIRDEREACCDDVVVSYMPHKRSYLEALVNFQEYTTAGAGTVIGLAGKKNYLLHRVKRMLTQENKKLNSMEKTVLLLSMIAFTAFGFVSEKETVDPKIFPPEKLGNAIVRNIPSAVNHTIKPETNVQRKKIDAVLKQKLDTVPGKNKKNKESNEDLSFTSISSNTNDDGNVSTTNIEAKANNGKKYRLKKVNGELTEFSVDGAIIPKEEYDNYNEVIWQIERHQYERRKMDNEVKQKDFQERLLKKEIMMREQMNKNKEQLAMRQESQRKNENQQKNELQRQNVREERNEKLMEKQELLKQRMIEQREKAELRREIGNTSNEEINRIINDLENFKLVTNTETLSFTLNKDELTVNGAKQPADIHKQLKEKYLDKPGDLFSYFKDGGTTRITITKD